MKCKERVYSFETRLECVRLFEEENLTPGKIAKKFGIVHSLVERWLEIYKYNGIEGLKTKTRYRKYDESFKSKIIEQVEIKKKCPGMFWKSFQAALHPKTVSISLLFCEDTIY